MEGSVSIQSILQANPSYALLSDAKLQLLLRSRHPEIPAVSLKRLKEIRQDFHAKEQEAREAVHARLPKPKSFYRLTGPLYSFQMDIMFLNKYRATNNGYSRALVAVDQLSRKAFVIPMKNSYTSSLLFAYQTFERDLPPNIIPVLIKADDEFNNAELKEYIERPGTVVKTVISKEENAGKGGGPLRLVDRFITTLRKNLAQYFISHASTNWVTAALPAVLNSYNEDQVHSSVGVTPGEAFQNTSDLLALRLGDQMYNVQHSEQGAQQLLAPGTWVRIVRARSAFDKASDSHRVSLARYEIEGIKDNKYRLKGLTRLFKTTEIVRARNQGAEASGHYPEDLLNRPESEVARGRLRKEGLEVRTKTTRPPRKAAAPRKTHSKLLDSFDSTDEEDNR